MIPPFNFCSYFSNCDFSYVKHWPNSDVYKKNNFTAVSLMVFNCLNYNLYSHKLFFDKLRYNFVISVSQQDKLLYFDSIITKCLYVSFND